VGNGRGVFVKVGKEVAVLVGAGVGGMLVAAAVITGRAVSVGGRVAAKAEVCVGKTIIGVLVGNIISCVGRLQPKKTIPSKLNKMTNFRKFRMFNPPCMAKTVYRL
jgi:hypothetical protein